MISMLKIFVLAISITIAMAATPAPTDIKVCYPDHDLVLPTEGDNIKTGAIELWQLINGQKVADGDSFKKIALGMLSWNMLGLQIASAVPGTGGAAAGVLMGLINMVAPKPLSRELECMRVLLDKLNQIQTKLNVLHKELNEIKELIHAIDPSTTYIIYRTELKFDQNALKTYASKKYPTDFDKTAATNACVNRSPSATRANIRDLLSDEAQFGMRLVEGLAAKSSCDSNVYAKYAAVILMDMLQLTVMGRACDSIAKASPESVDEGEAIAGMEMKEVGVALLKGRYEMERKCLQQGIDEKFQSVVNGLTCQGNYMATEMAKRLNGKYPLINVKRVKICGDDNVNLPSRPGAPAGKGERWSDVYRRKTCDGTPSNCVEKTAYFEIQNQKSKLHFGIMSNSTEAIVRFIKTQQNDHCEKNEIC